MRPRGFTAVELVAVISIAAVTAAVAAPALLMLSSTGESVAAAQVARDLSLARRHAIIRGARTWVVFDVPGGSYSLLAEQADSPGRAGALPIDDPAATGPIQQRVGGSVFLGAAITAAAFDGQPEVGFDALGRPLNSAESPLAANGTVTLTGGHSVVVRADGGTIRHVVP